MFETWQEQRQAIKKHILSVYDGTNSKNKAELDRFLEFIIGNYDLDDDLLAQIQEDLTIREDEDVISIEQLENEEYRFNILKEKRVW